jgi:hypothetical protein
MEDVVQRVKELFEESEPDITVIEAPNAPENQDMVRFPSH